MPAIADHLDVARRDLLHGLRVALRRPASSAIIVITIALAIGANAAIFSAVRAVLVRPLPVRALDRVVSVQTDLPREHVSNIGLAPAEVLDLAARGDVFQSLGSYSPADFNFTGAGEPRRLASAQTLGEFFKVFAQRPAAGRLLRSDDSEPGNEHVAVVSYGLWQELAAGSPSFVGSSIELNGLAYRVVGVLPAGFQYPRGTQVWVPFPYTPNWREPAARTALFMRVVGRLHDGVSMQALAAGLTSEMSHWHERFPNIYDANNDPHLRARPLTEQLAGELRPVLLALMGAVAFVLLIACANVASLVLVRAISRSTETAVRAALGAGRSALVRQSLVESIVLSLVGGMLGVIIGMLAMRLLARWASGTYEALRAAHLDLAVLLFSLAVTIAAGIIFGIAPALRTSRLDLQSVLRSGGRGASAGLHRSRFLRITVVAQVALMLVLLLGSGLTIRSLARLLQADPGFRAQQVTTMQISLPRARYTQRPQQVAFYDQLLASLRTMPGIQGAALTHTIPFSDQFTEGRTLDIIGHPVQPNERQPHSLLIAASSDYFRTMGIRLLRGRALAEADNATALRVAVIDEQLAKDFFPNEDPVGKRIAWGDTVEIVGVVSSVRFEELSTPPVPTVYEPYAQDPFRVMGIVVRSSLAVPAVTRAVRDALAAQDPGIALFDVQLMEQRVDQSLGTRRLAMIVLTGFAALSLTLAIFGMYGVLSYVTSQRTREIGIRVALGARPQDVTRMVLGEALVLAAVGLLLGAALALALGRVLGALVYGVTAHDPGVIALCVALSALTLGTAAWLPARRAARVDPTITLRDG